MTDCFLTETTNVTSTGIPDIPFAIPMVPEDQCLAGSLSELPTTDADR